MKKKNSKEFKKNRRKLIKLENRKKENLKYRKMGGGLEKCRETRTKFWRSNSEIWKKSELFLESFKRKLKLLVSLMKTCRKFEEKMNTKLQRI